MHNPTAHAPNPLFVLNNLVMLMATTSPLMLTMVQGAPIPHTRIAVTNARLGDHVLLSCVTSCERSSPIPKRRFCDALGGTATTRWHRHQRREEIGLNAEKFVSSDSSERDPVVAEVGRQGPAAFAKERRAAPTFSRKARCRRQRTGQSNKKTHAETAGVTQNTERPSAARLSQAQALRRSKTGLYLRSGKIVRAFMRLHLPDRATRDN